MVILNPLMSESKIQNFNHLKIHSQYSICEGAIKIDNTNESVETTIKRVKKLIDERY